eukprot:TRINITY_DN4250_c0_g3_i2.p1 TRINITY_DN4250_c0_g3~~TRINITY_DN4250_c0_g3_i2.p1  ORF type:complete len:899 (-),score=230.20 TRINITY_DN4250_c0_g3_i2:84-2780(-)
MESPETDINPMNRSRSSTHSSLVRSLGPSSVTVPESEALETSGQDDEKDDLGAMSRSVPTGYGAFMRAGSAPDGHVQLTGDEAGVWNSWRGERLKETMRAEVEQWGDNLLKQNLLFSEGVLDLGLGICQDSVLTTGSNGQDSVAANTRMTDVVVMGSLLFLDVCLRHASHPDLREWREVSLQLYEMDTEAAAWMLSQLAAVDPLEAPKKPWLEKLCLYHPDKFVRNSICSVLRTCVSRVLQQGQPGQIPLNVSALVSTLLAKFQVANSTALGVEAYCNVWSTMAVVSNHCLRQHLLEQEVAAYLLHLYLQDTSPAKGQLPEITVLKKEEEESYCRSLHVVQQMLASVESPEDVTPLTLELLTSNEFIHKVVETNPDQLADTKKPLLWIMLTVAHLSCEDMVQMLLGSLKPGQDKMMAHRKEALLACAEHVGLPKLLAPTFARAKAESEVRGSLSYTQALFLLQVANSAAKIDVHDPELEKKLGWYRQEVESWVWAVEWLAVETSPRSQCMVTGMDTQEARQCYQLLQHVQSLLVPSEDKVDEEAVPLEQLCLRVENAGRTGLNTVYVFHSYDRDGFGMWVANVGSMYTSGYEEMFIFRREKDDSVHWHLGIPSTAFKGGYDRKWYSSQTMSKDSVLELPCKDGWKSAVGDMGPLPVPQVSAMRMSELIQGSEEDGDMGMRCSACSHVVCVSMWYRAQFDDYQCPECLNSVEFPDKDLLAAAYKNDVESMIPLLEADLCWLDRPHGDENRTSLHAAARSGHADVVALLLDAKCSVDPKAGDWTPLMNAAYHGTPDKIAAGAGFARVAELLLEAKADTRAIAEGRNAKAWAKSRNNLEMLAVFEKFELEQAHADEDVIEFAHDDLGPDDQDEFDGGDDSPLYDTHFNDVYGPHYPHYGPL